MTGQSGEYYLKIGIEAVSRRLTDLNKQVERLTKEFAACRRQLEDAQDVINGNMTAWEYWQRYREDDPS